MALLTVAAVSIFLQPIPQSFRSFSIYILIHRAANGNPDAVEDIRHLGPSDLPVLCRIIATSTPWSWEVRLEALRQNVPERFRGFIPNVPLAMATAAQARFAVTAMNDWGPHFAAVVRAEASAITADPQASYGGVISTASRRTIQDPTRHADPETVAAFIGGLTNTESWNRVHCVFALAAIGPTATSAVPALRLRLNDRSRTVAQHAAEALWRITGDRRNALETLLASLGSKDDEVQKAIRLDLGRIAPQVAADCPSRSVLIADNIAVDRPTRAVPAVCGPGGPITWAYLRMLESDSDPDVAAAAQAARARMRDEGLWQGVLVPE
jgi:hypothetical protein